MPPPTDRQLIERLNLLHEKNIQDELDKLPEVPGAAPAGEQRGEQLGMTPVPANEQRGEQSATPVEPAANGHASQVASAQPAQSVQHDNIASNADEGEISLLDAADREDALAQASKSLAPKDVAPPTRTYKDYCGPSGCGTEDGQDQTNSLRVDPMKVPALSNCVDRLPDCQTPQQRREMLNNMESIDPGIAKNKQFTELQENIESSEGVWQKLVKAVKQVFKELKKALGFDSEPATKAELAPNADQSKAHGAALRNFDEPRFATSNRIHGMPAGPEMGHGL